MKIPIKKHTKVRRRVSRFGIQLGDKVPVVIGDSESKLAPLVQDIKPVREVSVAGYAEDGFRAAPNYNHNVIGYIVRFKKL